MLARAWFFMAGMAFAFALVMASMGSWAELAFFASFAAFAVAAPMRGWFWTGEEALRDATQQFRNARLRLVRGEDESHGR